MNSNNNTTTLPAAQHLNDAGIANARQSQGHQAFTWIPLSAEGDPDAEFAALVKDVTNGAALALEMVQTSNMDRDCEDTPTLNENQTEKMLFLAIRSLELLGGLADDRIQRMEKHADAKAAKRASAASDEEVAA
jgi:hypothetical protein